jgi:hypothetical protein
MPNWIKGELGLCSSPPCARESSGDRHPGPCATVKRREREIKSILGPLLFVRPRLPQPRLLRRPFRQLSADRKGAMNRAGARADRLPHKLCGGEKLKRRHGFTISSEARLKFRGSPRPL